MTTRVAPPPPGRRTQGERRAATRAALLDATIACIVDDGYARTTTRSIAERAGVTAGAQHHHFSSKAELMAEAVQDLAGRLAADLIADGAPRGGSGLERAGDLLDRVWQVHNGRLFAAALELWVAARTDPELETALQAVDADIRSQIDAAGPVLFPTLTRPEEFRETVLVALATMRGLAVQAFVAGTDPGELWPAARAQMLARLAGLVGDGEPS